MTPPRSGWALWRACVAGQEPAESLDPRDREDLFAELLAAGWTVHDIAVHTRTSTYTTARIIDRVTATTDAAAAVADACRRRVLDRIAGRTNPTTTTATTESRAA